MTVIPADFANSQSITLTADCIRPDDKLSLASTEEMLGLLGSYSAQWESNDSFTVGGIGAQNRLFDPRGRLIHPGELAALISGAPSFTDKKRKLVTLGVSDSSLGGNGSYADRLSKLLGAKVEGCTADAFFFARGGMICGTKPLFIEENPDERARRMPAGFALNGAMLMLFCADGTSAISPKSILTSSVAFGLRKDELVALQSEAATQPEAAFRLYQYHWIARRDAQQAMPWLEKAAALGSDVAQYNLAYELLERNQGQDRERANSILTNLVAKGFHAPDLRTFYLAT